jgi:hypothetical protein
MAYEVKGYPEGYDILEKKQSQKTHIPQLVVKNMTAAISPPMIPALGFK